MRAAGFARRRAQQRPQLPAQAEQPPAVARLQGQPRDGTQKVSLVMSQAARCIRRLAAPFLIWAFASILGSHCDISKTAVASEAGYSTWRMAS